MEKKSKSGDSTLSVCARQIKHEINESNSIL